LKGFGLQEGSAKRADKMTDVQIRNLDAGFERLPSIEGLQAQRTAEQENRVLGNQATRTQLATAATPEQATAARGADLASTQARTKLMQAQTEATLNPQEKMITPNKQLDIEIEGLAEQYSARAAETAMNKMFAALTPKERSAKLKEQKTGEMLASFKTSQLDVDPYTGRKFKSLSRVLADLPLNDIADMMANENTPKILKDMASRVYQSVSRDPIVTYSYIAPKKSGDSGTMRPVHSSDIAKTIAQYAEQLKNPNLPPEKVRQLLADQKELLTLMFNFAEKGITPTDILEKK